MEFTISSTRGLVMSGFDIERIKREAPPENVKLFLDFLERMKAKVPGFANNAPISVTRVETIATPPFIRGLAGAADRSERRWREEGGGLAEAQRRGWRVVK